jgi:acetoacetyl-CoA reductase/3-oxoacyl-[acyl-carrier protein] reductase
VDKASPLFLNACKFRKNRVLQPPDISITSKTGDLVMGRLTGKTALVTGASRGIGRAIAIELAREGARVAINYQSNDAKAKEVVDEIAKMGGSATLAKANVTDPKEARAMVKKVADEFGHLDILVNNAGITRDSMLRKMTDENWIEVIQTNLNSVFYCISAAVPIMTGQSYGRIVNISSVNGQTAAIGQANYSASKGGIIALTKTAAMELAKSGITVNAIAPGYTETDMVSKVPADIQTQIKSKIPLGRFAQPEEIAKAVLFLVTDGDYITGQQLNVNGGMFM